jgi:hypothetical protein
MIKREELATSPFRPHSFDPRYRTYTVSSQEIKETREEVKKFDPVSARHTDAGGGIRENGKGVSP